MQQPLRLITLFLLATLAVRPSAEAAAKPARAFTH